MLHVVLRSLSVGMMDPAMAMNFVLLPSLCQRIPSVHNTISPGHFCQGCGCKIWYCQANWLSAQRTIRRRNSSESPNPALVPISLQRDSLASFGSRVLKDIDEDMASCPERFQSEVTMPAKCLSPVLASFQLSSSALTTLFRYKVMAYRG